MSLLTPLILTRSRMVSLLFVLLVTLIGSTCGPGNPIGPEKGGSASANSNKNTSSTSTTSTTSSTGDKIGVPECDDFIAKYEACTDKVPEAGRAQYKDALAKWRASWKQLAANPATKGTLAAACKQASDSSAASWKAYGCGQ
jgi:hypothetical protein